MPSPSPLSQSVLVRVATLTNASSPLARAIHSRANVGRTHLFQRGTHYNYNSQGTRALRKKQKAVLNSGLQHVRARLLPARSLEYTEEEEALTALLNGDSVGDVVPPSVRARAGLAPSLPSPPFLNFHSGGGGNFIMKNR